MSGVAATDPGVPAPSVGVVIPTRDNAATVAAAVASVLAQSPVPDDVVVVDGGSTDATVGIVEQIIAATAGVRLVRQTGTGLGAARNQGIAELGTDLVAFCDADDRWTPTALGVRLAHLLAHPACHAVTGRYVDDATTTVGPPRPALTPGGVLIRRDALDRVGPFVTHLRIATDSEWLVRVRQTGHRLDVLDEVVLVKGRRATSLSTDVGAYRAELLTVARDFLDRRR